MTGVEVAISRPREWIVDPRTLWPLLCKELRDSLRNKWFILYTVVFVALSIGLAYLSQLGTGYAGLAGFGKTAASLVNLTLLVVPLMGITMGALSLSGERDRGMLAYVLAQPVTRTEVFFAKFMGQSAAFVATIGIGFGLSAMLLSRHGSADGALFLWLAGLSMLLALSMLAIGMLIGTLVRHRRGDRSFHIRMALRDIAGGPRNDGRLDIAVAGGRPDVVHVGRESDAGVQARVHRQLRLDAGLARTGRIVCRAEVRRLAVPAADWPARRLDPDAGGGGLGRVRSETAMRKVFAILCFMLLPLASCERSPTEITAPRVHFGQDVCAKCAMIISDERFAGAIGMRKQGRIVYLLFDDVGEMLEFDPGDCEEIRWFATDAVTREWLDAETAVFLHSDKLVTPMGTGIGAYSTREAATRAQQDRGGTIRVFTDLRAAD